MIRTAFAFAAYHETMELLIVLLLLALCEKNSELKETLQSALKFYRENRELFVALSSPNKEQKGEEKSASSERSAEEKTADSLKLIEQFLKRQ